VGDRIFSSISVERIKVYEKKHMLYDEKIEELDLNTPK